MSDPRLDILKEAGVFPVKDNFGEMDRGDATSIVERRADQAGKDADFLINKVMPSVLNRAPDSHPVPKEGELKDWAATIMDEQTLKARYDGFANMQSYGPNRARLEMLRWHNRMEKGMNDA